MDYEEHSEILKQGIKVWNNWREENPDIEPDLRGATLSKPDYIDANFAHANLSNSRICGVLANANLRNANLFQADLHFADLKEADLQDSNLRYANLNKADLKCANLKGVILQGAKVSNASLIRADLSESDLTGAILRGADLRGARCVSTTFIGADLSNADLAEANLTGSIFIRTILNNANLAGCRIFGVSVWEVKMHETMQNNLIISPESQPDITLDNLEVAQFVYLLLNNEKIRHVIDTITSKVVLILGRFTEIRKAVLDAIREELRKRDYLPILFDFEKPSSRNLTETISTLAHMARFVIADLTDAKSIPQELQRIVPDMPSLPVQPVILSSQYEYAMFKDLLDYQSVLIPHRFDDMDDLLATLHEKVIKPAIDKAEEIQQRRKAIEQQLANR